MPAEVIFPTALSQSEGYSQDNRPNSLLLAEVFVVPHDGTKKWIRTTDLRDMSPLLCQLSYLGIMVLKVGVEPTHTRY